MEFLPTDSSIEPSVQGIANTTVTLRDGGGTDNGGQDLSATENLNIIITSAQDPIDILIVDVIPDPRNAPVDEISIVFSEQVIGFDLADLELRRDGGGNLIDDTVTQASNADSFWTLGNLGGLTDLAGEYTLTFDGSLSGVPAIVKLNLNNSRKFKHPNLEMMIRKIFITAMTILLCLSAGVRDATARERWTPDQANAWYAQQPWLVGCNFSPSSAINQLEMWQADTFDPETIDRELGWAEDLGFNSVRVYLHNLLWQQDREEFLNRIDQFLAIAEKHSIGVVMVPLDGVWDPHPKLGKQRAPRPHVHNSGWLQAPGAEILSDPNRHDELRPYITGLIHHFRNDKRIQVWDVFNEPDNANVKSYGTEGTNVELSNKAEMATLLLKKVYQWAREADPSQPLTASVWLGPWPDHEKMLPIEKVMLEQSDVISFHNYGGLDQVRPRIKQLRRYHRPILCTEYMARPNGSHFDPVMGYFKQEKIGAYNWGFVAGKTQTHYPWDSWDRDYTGEPEVWFHEILRGDGTPYDPKETNYIKSLTGKQ